MYPDLNGSQMGALSWFVMDALLRRLVEKGIISSDDVGVILADANNNLGRFGQSEAKRVVEVLEGRLIPEVKKRSR
jgi:hypothetical protein